MNKLPSELKNSIVRLRREGLLYKAIAKQLGVKIATVARVCRTYVPELREIAHPRIPIEDQMEISRLRRKGYSYEEISQRVGYCVDTIMSYCHKYCPGLKNICHPWKVSKKTEQSVCYLYESGMTIKDVMKKLRLGYKAVSRSLHRNGFNQRRGWRLIRHS